MAAEQLRIGGMLLDVVKLTSGAAGGRLLLLAAMPLVTRLYNPEAFSLLATYMALVSTLTVIACLRLEIAIPLADNDDDGASLLLLALLSAAVLTGLLLLVTLVMPDNIASAVGNPEIAPYLWLVSVGVWVSASYLAFMHWATRARRFGTIGRTRLGQAVVGAATMLGLGWLGVVPLGLLLGNMLTIGAGGLRLGLQSLRKDWNRLRAVNRGGVAAAMRRYRRYPLLSMPEALANVAGIQVPILVIASQSDEGAGQLFLAMQVMAAPLALLGVSIGQVYLSRARDVLREGRLATFTFSIVRRLLLVGAVPLLAVAVISPFAFPSIFGAEWARAGVIIAWIAPWMLLQLAVSPVSMSLHIVGRQDVALALQIFGLSFRTGAVLTAVSLGSAYLVEAYAVSSFAFYAIYLIIVIAVQRRAA